MSLLKAIQMNIIIIRSFFLNKINKKNLEQNKGNTHRKKDVYDDGSK